MPWIVSNGEKTCLDLLIQNYDQDSDKGYILEVDVNYPKELHKLHSGMPFLSKKMKIDKCEKLLCNLHDKKIYAIQTRALKQALDHGLILESSSIKKHG